MRNFFKTLFFIFSICLILVADYEDQPYYALFGLLIIISAIGYVKADVITEFFNEPK